MVGKLEGEILCDHHHDRIDRRGFLKCMAWAGTGAFCVMSGGVLKSYSLSRLPEMSSRGIRSSTIGNRESRIGRQASAYPIVTK
jgi:hypothetical protein